MNRRTFLKSIATVCGAAVVCPGELLKPNIVTTINANGLLSQKDISGRWRHTIIQKARQQGCTNSILYGLPKCYFRGVPIYYQENLSA